MGGYACKMTRVEGCWVCLPSSPALVNEKLKNRSMKLTTEHACARLFVCTAFLLACLGLSACSVGGLGSSSGSNLAGTSPQGAPAGGTVKVALLLPLSGNVNAQQVAKAMKQAGELALFDFDKPNVKLIPKDTHGTPEGARQAAQDAVKEGATVTWLATASIS
jgi:ABC-type sugar transport system substrate-binding protein